ncbi:MAG: hypothetical protein VZQ98_17245, partial [Bacteroidales bacterium]|nr:hypothetical protein [Bacteroidales bacterium]
IWTKASQLPPVKFIKDSLGNRSINVNSVISVGCVVYGSEILNSVLFDSVTIEQENLLEQVVIFPSVIIHKGCRIRKAIIERGCEIPEGMRIGHDLEEDRKFFYVSPKGVVLVDMNMLKKYKEHFSTSKI